MTRDEAKLILQAYRPDGGEGDEAFFTEALGLIDQDPELAAWWQAEQEFDRRVVDKLGQVPVPPDLRETLLATEKIVPFQPRRPVWISAAAAAVVIGFLAAHYLWTPAEAMTQSDYTASVMPYIQQEPALDMTASEQAQVVAWLKAHQSPTGPLPPGVAALPTVGCEKLAVHGHRVSLICFQVDGNKLVHLFVVNDGALTNPPGPSPEWGQHQDWSTVAWTTDHMSFVMATRAGPDTLKELF